MITLNQITDVVFLSLFWLLLCFPLVTAGPATAALYDTAVRTFRRGEPHPWHRFWTSFRQNLKTGIPACVIWLGIGAAGGWTMIQIWNGAVAGTVAWPVFSGAAFVCFAAFGLWSVVFPLLSRFETGVIRLFVNAAVLGIGNLPRTLGLAAVYGASVYACIRWIWPLFVLPCLSALIGSFFLEPMFKPYMPANPEQPKEA